MRDSAGDETSQIYYQHVGEAAARRLTDGKSINGGAVWSSSGREIAFSTIARDTGSGDIDIIDPTAARCRGSPRAVTARTGASSTGPPTIASSSCAGTYPPYEDYLYVLDLGTGQKREVDPSAAKGAIPSAKFSRDGTGVYFVSNRDSDYARLRFVNLFTAEKTDLSGRGAADVEQFALSKDGHYLAYVTDEGGADKLESRRSCERIRISLRRACRHAGVVDSLSFDPDGRRLLFGLTAANHPRDAYVLDLDGQPARSLDRERSRPTRSDEVRRAAPHAVPDLRSGGW